MTAELWHLGRAAATILCMFIFHVASSDSRAQARISGEMGPSLAALQKLRYLDLSRNDFYGASIPLFMGSLENLRYLNLSSSSLSGRIPSQLGNLSNLRYLDVGGSDNYLDVVDLAWLSRLSLLSYLDLSNANLSPVQDWFHMELHLSHCVWHGPIPEELGNMTSLQVIDFDYNDLVGLISSNLRNLCHLEELYLDYNNFNVNIGEFLNQLPRCSWSTIQVLSLANMITGTVPLEVGALSNLTELDLSYNKLNGVLMKEHFSSLFKLEYLELGGNSLKIDIEQNWVPPFGLKSIDLGSCLVGPRFPEWIRWQADVYSLCLRNANLDDVIPEWFWVTFFRTKFLDASGNKLHGSLPANLQHMSVRMLYLGSNMLIGQIPGLPVNISYLNLSSNSFSGSLPSKLKAPLLEQLLLANNQITGTIPSSICQLTELRRLELSGNNLTGDVMQCWMESDSNSSVSNTNSAGQFGSVMVSLDLSNNDLSGEFPKFLQSAKNLVFLDLSFNRFFGILPKWLPEKIPLLQILRVRSNMFSGHIPKNLTDLESLYHLDIARNNISGSIPWSLSSLKAMRVISRKRLGYDFEENDLEVSDFEESVPVITKGQTRDYTFGIYGLVVNLDFSCNSLTGQIPEEIKLLIGLTNLNLSSNQLIGKIPIQIGALKQLESLDLSYNKLSGEIPSGLSALTSLSYLNLSYNNLSGMIPSGPQLQALDNQIDIYIGNPGLCGYPLSKNCSASTTDAEPSVDHEDVDHISYLYLGMGIGFVVGLWVVFCTMLLKRSWTIAYFQIIDKLYDEVYVRVAITWARLMKKTHDDAV
ncbi:receptor-like protein EIX2 [Triticum urartu]|uniref:receptor-like protein EIX2 n=1 Tax=Triticum urartu TaxID=4572 RepID=UPI0020430938|nr:receptor-like protein EIX2 [Triticum urartu]